MRLLLATLLLAACTPPPATVTPPATFDEFVHRAAAATCDALTRCGDERGLVVDVRTELTDCPTQLADYELSAIYGGLRAALARGTVVFHPEDAETCFAALAASPCEANGTPAVCSALFEPRVADGDACASSLECVSGGLCTYAGSCGTCQPMRGAAGCAASADCEYGWFCGAGACHRRADVGEACDDAFLDACRDALDCVDGACAARVRGEGASCANDFECMSGTHCVGRMCARLATGQCARQSDCAIDAYCAVENMQSPHPCMPYPDVGAICAGACVSGAFCPIGVASGVPTCVVADGTNGSACTSDSDCFTHHCVAGACAFVSGCTL